MNCSVLFCQAEDGIRGLVRSRGLGDVYKRQVFDAVLNVVVQRFARLVSDPGDRRRSGLRGVSKVRYVPQPNYYFHWRKFLTCNREGELLTAGEARIPVLGSASANPAQGEIAAAGHQIIKGGTTT